MIQKITHKHSFAGVQTFIQMNPDKKPCITEISFHFEIFNTSTFIVEKFSLALRKCVTFNWIIPIASIVALVLFKMSAWPLEKSSAPANGISHAQKALCRFVVECQWFCVLIEPLLFEMSTVNRIDFA